MLSLNIMYTANERYIERMLASMCSLILNSKLEKINFHIVESGFSEDNKKRICDFINNYKNVSVDFYPFDEEMISGYNIPNWRETQISNARLFYASIVKEKHPDAKNLLYIDSDTLVLGDLTGLESYNDCLICATQEDHAKKIHYKKKYGLKEYYCSGVLYLNLDKWIKLGYEEKVKEYMSNHKDIKLVYPDQDLLNLMFEGQITTLPTKYNVSVYPFYFKRLGASLFYIGKQAKGSVAIKAKQNPSIVHSLGLYNIKFWHNSRVNPLKKYYIKYVEMVNKDYELEELDGSRKFFDRHPILFKQFMIFRAILPPSFEKWVRNIAFKFSKSRKKK